MFCWCYLSCLYVFSRAESPGHFGMELVSFSTFSFSLYFPSSSRREPLEQKPIYRYVTIVEHIMEKCRIHKGGGGGGRGGGAGGGVGGWGTYVISNRIKDYRFLRKWPVHITKTRLFKYIEYFTIKKAKISDKKFWYFFFSYFCSKHRLWVFVRTASARRF